MTDDKRKKAEAALDDLILWRDSFKSFLEWAKSVEGVGKPMEEKHQDVIMFALVDYGERLMEQNQKAFAAIGHVGFTTQEGRA